MCSPRRWEREETEREAGRGVPRAHEPRSDGSFGRRAPRHMRTRRPVCWLLLRREALLRWEALLRREALLRWRARLCLPNAQKALRSHILTLALPLSPPPSPPTSPPPFPPPFPPPASLPGLPLGPPPGPPPAPLLSPARDSRPAGRTIRTRRPTHNLARFPRRLHFRSCHRPPPLTCSQSAPVPVQWANVPAAAAAAPTPLCLQTQRLPTQRWLRTKPVPPTPQAAPVARSTMIVVLVAARSVGPKPPPRGAPRPPLGQR